MIWTVDPTAPEPLYAQLAAQVHVALSRGGLSSGDRLPSARDLSDSLDLNIHTVLHAFQLLRDEGVIELRRGRGAVVTADRPPAMDEARAALSRYVATGRAAGMPNDALVALLKEALRS